MFEFFGDAIGAILSGGATGLIGSVVSVWGEYKKNQQLFEHKEHMAKLDQESMRLEADLELKKITTEGEVQIGISEAQTLSASFEHDKAAYYTGQLGKLGRAAMVFIDFMRGLIRPAMTIYLVILTTLIYWEIDTLVNKMDGVMSVNLAAQLLQQIIMVILYLTTTVVLWWFGTRQKIIKGD